LKNISKITAAGIIALFMGLLLCGCQLQYGGNASGEGADIDLDDAVTLTLAGDRITGSGKNVEIDGSTATIYSGGTYVLTGSLNDGQIIVNAEDKDVTLVLDGADITCSYSSPLYIYQCHLVSVYLTEGSRNSLTDGESYLYQGDLESEEKEEPDACLYSKSDMTVSGTGSLTVNANYRNGIIGKDTLAIEDAVLTVNAVNHGINGRDQLTLDAVTAQVTAGGDGLRSNNDTAENVGWISVKNSVLTLETGNDGIQAETTLELADTTCTVTAGGGSDRKISEDISAKGFKSGGDMTFSGGCYTVDTPDDGLHAGGNLTVEDGVFAIASGDDGIHADAILYIKGGSVDISQSYEGLEGLAVEISGGDISLYATDDGINAAGGADQSGFGGVGGDMGMMEASEDSWILISGGNLHVNAWGDGLDSNGNLTVTGGVTYVSGPTDNGNGALDFGGTGTVTGGILVAAGSTGMAQNFGSDSTQGSILINFNYNDESPVIVYDQAGNELINWTPDKTYSGVVVTCPDMTLGGSYTVSAAGKETEITLSDSLIYGNTENTGMGGMGGRGMGGGQFGKK